MKNYDSIRHVKGESLFIDDLSIPSSALYCAVYASPIAHGKILSINLEEAKASEGVVAVYTHSDIPGENQIGGIIQDEKLLATDHVHFIGEPVALIVAKTQSNARLAAKKVKVEFEKLEVIIHKSLKRKDAAEKNITIIRKVAELVTKK